MSSLPPNIDEILARIAAGEPVYEFEKEMLRSAVSTQEVQDELIFLRYFFDAAGDAFGPADHDVYCYIMQEYENTTGRAVPKPYALGYLTEEAE